MHTEEITDLLRRHTLKVTPQRAQIIASLDAQGHLSVDSIYEEVRRVHPNVSLATVYKNITLMTQNALLEEVKIPSHKSVYEITKPPHHHLVCEACGKIEDFVLPVETIREHVAGESGYAIRHTCVLLRGECPVCQGK